MCISIPSLVYKGQSWSEDLKRLTITSTYYDSKFPYGSFIMVRRDYFTLCCLFMLFSKISILGFIVKTVII